MGTTIKYQLRRTSQTLKNSKGCDVSLRRQPKNSEYLCQVCPPTLSDCFFLFPLPYKLQSQKKTETTATGIFCGAEVKRCSSSSEKSSWPTNKYEFLEQICECCGSGFGTQVETILSVRSEGFSPDDLTSRVVLQFGS